MQFRSRENNTIYMEACNIVGNAAFEAGGGIYHEVFPTLCDSVWPDCGDWIKPSRGLYFRQTAF